jgi:hypothetical protein
MHAEGALGGREDGLLQRLDQHLAVDVLVFADLIENQAQARRRFIHDALLEEPLFRARPRPSRPGPASRSPPPPRSVSWLLARRNSASQSGTRFALTMLSMGT